jgi:hypothetical protein
VRSAPGNLVTKDPLGCLAQPPASDFRELAAGVDVDSFAIEFVGIFRSIVTPQ